VLACAQVKPHGDGSRELASLVVAPDARGQGLARAVIQHLQASNPPPLYLTCRAALQPFYRKFGFHTLAPEAMPLYFVRIWRIFRLIARLTRRPMRLAVMRWDGAQ